MPPDREHAIGTSLRVQRCTAARISDRKNFAQSSTLRCCAVSKRSCQYFSTVSFCCVEIVGELVSGRNPMDILE